MRLFEIRKLNKSIIILGALEIEFSDRYNQLDLLRPRH